MVHAVKVSQQVAAFGPLTQPIRLLLLKYTTVGRSDYILLLNQLRIASGRNILKQQPN